MDIKIRSYEDFLEAVNKAGFSMSGGNSEGIFSAISWNWKAEPPYATPVSWHTGDREFDPWQWRVRILEEARGISYGKVFFKKGGFITRQWAPYFLSARRRGLSFQQAYQDGTISHAAKSIYEIIENEGSIALHRLKAEAGISKASQSAFERTLVELQMGLFITINGEEQKVSLEGAAYGWSSTVFTTTEKFWGPEVFKEAQDITQETALDSIRQQILSLNPAAKDSKIRKFILG